MQYRVIYITNSAISVITNFFAERLPNIFNIKTSNTEDEEYQAGVKANDDRYRALIKQEKIFVFMSPIGSLAQYINEIILLLVATALVRKGTMEMFQMVNLYNYYMLFMSNAMYMQKNARQFYDGEGIVKKGIENTINNVSQVARDGMLWLFGRRYSRYHS